MGVAELPPTRACHSSFLLQAGRAAERYGVPAHELLAEAGLKATRAGQDTIVGVDIRLARAAA